MSRSAGVRMTPMRCSMLGPRYAATKRSRRNRAMRGATLHGAAMTLPVVPAQQREDIPYAQKQGTAVRTHRTTGNSSEEPTG